MKTDILYSLVSSIHPKISSSVSSNYTISSSDFFIKLGSLSSNINIKLPASPDAGDQYTILDSDGSLSLYSATVDGYGNQICDSSTFVLSQKYASVTLTFSGDKWIITSFYPGFGNGSGVGLFSNRPLQGQPGRTYYAIDAGCFYVDDGNKWYAVGNIQYNNPLKTSDFTWQNQNSATSTDFGSSIFLTAPSNGSTSNIRFLYKNVPTTPYVITACFVHLGAFKTANSASLYGLAWGDGTKFTTFHVNTGDTTYDLNVANWNSASSFNANVYAANDTAISNQLSWMRIADDGSNRSASVSRDGVNFSEVWSAANNSFLTPTRVGIILNPYLGDQQTSCVSWKVE